MAFPIQIDTTQLTHGHFLIPNVTGDELIDGKTIPTLQIEPGSYSFQLEGAGPIAVFTITPQGTVNYDDRFNQILSGKGTTKLAINGFEVTLDASNLKNSGIFLTALTPQSREQFTSKTLRLAPGSYRIQQRGGVVATFQFTVELDGTFNYDAAHDTSSGGFMSGKGSTTLQLVGYTIQIDTTQLSYPRYILAGISPTPLDGKTIQTLQLLPDSYNILNADFSFNVTPQGLIDFDPALSNFLAGQASKTLTISGFSVTLDGQRFPRGILLIAISAFIKRETVRLFPGTYSVQQTGGFVANFTFKLERDGTFSYDSAFDTASGGFLTGRGTSTLGFIGYPVLLDGRAFQNIPMLIHGINVSNSTPELQPIPFLPHTEIALSLNTNPPATAEFALEQNGTITLKEPFPFLELQKQDNQTILKLKQPQLNPSPQPGGSQPLQPVPEPASAQQGPGGGSEGGGDEGGGGGTLPNRRGVGARITSFNGSASDGNGSVLNGNSSDGVPIQLTGFASGTRATVKEVKIRMRDSKGGFRRNEAVTLTETGSDGLTTNYSWSYQTTFSTVVSDDFKIQAEATSSGSQPIHRLSNEIKIRINIVDNTRPKLEILSPSNGDLNKGLSIQVSGTASDNSGVNGVNRVECKVDDGAFIRANPTASNWSTWNIFLTFANLGDHRITARCFDHSNNVTEKTITVKAADTTAPTLTITSPPSVVIENKEKTVLLSGNALDTLTGVSEVTWEMPDPPQSGVATPSSPGNWFNWSAVLPNVTSGDRQVIVRCKDKAGNETVRGKFFKVNRPFIFKDTDPFSPFTYLADLLEFATERLKLQEPPASQPAADAVDEALLTKIFFQPFAELIEAASNVANQPVSQLRICVEVLRQYLAILGPSTAIQTALGQAESNYRQTAYETLMNRLGTSYDEIRLVRNADEKTLKALADRLGIDPKEADGASRIVKLFLEPGQITETNLENLFGLINTAQNPLRLIPPSTLQTWQLEHLQTLWVEQVYAKDSVTDSPRPLIDPALIDTVDLKDAIAGNPAFDLWQERRTWIETQIKEIKTHREAETTPLAGFDKIVASVIGSIQDLLALEEDRKQGKDIKPQLKLKKLSLPAFIALMHTRGLAAAGAVLDREWLEVYTILIEVRKQGEFSAWRLAEQQKNLTLSSSYFQVSAQPTPRSSSPLGRLGQLVRQARQEWQSALQSNIQQEQAVLQGLQSAIAATEETVLPLLRDALVQAIDTHVNLDFDVSNWLTERLLVDVDSSGSQRTTRLQQATETLQDLLFSVRSGRFEKHTISVPHPKPLGGTTSPGPRPTFPMPMEEMLVATTTSNGISDAVSASANPTADLSGTPTPTSFDPTSPAARWTFKDESNFDKEWQWMGSYANWRAAMFVFLYPENLLLPSLRSELDDTTEAFKTLIGNLQKNLRLTPKAARDEADAYLKELRKNAELDPKFPEAIKKPFFFIGSTNSQEFVRGLFGNITNPHEVPKYVKEVFYFVPMALALQLQKSGEYLAALDWFQTVYAYDQPFDKRKIYTGLALEEKLGNAYQRNMEDWLIKSLNPHIIVTTPRANAYTRFTLMSLVRCFLDFADAEFARDTRESVPRARGLYLSALELLELPNMQTPPPTDTSTPPPPNPAIKTLQSRAEINLTKIRKGLNIAGMERQFELDARAEEEIPSIDQDGQLVLSRTASFQPTPYYYAVLIERSKQLIALAQQIEASFLAAIEKTDVEDYGLLRAGHDLDLANAGVELQKLRVTEATNSGFLAQLQTGRAQLQVDHYKNLLEQGTSELERQALVEMQNAIDFYSQAEDWTMAGAYAGAVSSAISGVLNGVGAGPAGIVAGIFGGASGATASIANGQSAVRSLKASQASTRASIAGTNASYERRSQEWQLQKSLADKDVEIGNQQIIMAQDHMNVVQKESDVAETQADNAKAVVRFLANKFTNAELYEWMSGVLGQVYRYFLQQATAMARLAQAQLAFERQSTPPSFIQSDYWQVQSDAGVLASTNNNQPDRRGLTGSARLMQDIYQLDNYAFETNRRKLQLTQTFSLARLTPFEFQRFRETGELLFATPRELFDREFPGHYLRLIRRVRTSVIALVPPHQGIRATLTASGLSRTVISGDIFQSVVIRRNPELIAFTSPSNATGLFELDVQSDMLLPFEGMGVDTTWEFQMPKAANPFDYRTIADVLITIEYTALHSFDYRQQVIQSLNPNLSADRPLSLSTQFPDQWYDLHNPDQTNKPFTVQFKTLREDFPPNVDDLRIEQVVMYFVRSSNATYETMEVANFSLTEEGSPAKMGGAASTTDDILSTRRGNASSWTSMIGKSPFGTWELSFHNNGQTREIFEESQFEDILLVITYKGRTPEWTL